MTTSHQKEQAERKALAGSTTGMTYHSRAITGLDLERSGRHAQHAVVTGSARVPQYPAASGPWNDPVQVPDEPPLGYAIDSQEPVGEVFEIEASLREASPSVASLTPDGDVATARTTPSAGAKEASAVSTSAADASNFIRRARKL
jgi:hypothetical protein